MIAALRLVLVAAANVLARNAALGPTNNYIAPVGLQIGTINQNITCNLTLGGAVIIQNAVFSLVLGGALANGVGRNQGYYITGRAIITGSKAFTQLLQQIQVTSINGTLASTVIIAQGSKNGTYDVAKFKTVTVPSQTIKSNTGIVLNIPNVNDSALQIGPILANSTASQIVIAVGAAVFNAKAVSAGQVVPVVITCPQAKTLSYLAFTTVGGNGTKTVGPNRDYKPVTTLPSGSVLGSSGLNYSCKVTGITNALTIPISLTTYSSKLNVTHGTKFQYLNSHGTVNISQAAVVALQATLTTKASAFQIQVLNISTSGTGINPTTVPVLAHSVTSNITKLSSTTGTYLVDIPGQNGVLPPVNYTASSTPGTALIYLGNAQVNIIALSSTNAVLKTFAASCTAPTSPKIPLLPQHIV